MHREQAEVAAIGGTKTLSFTVSSTERSHMVWVLVILGARNWDAGPRELHDLSSVVDSGDSGRRIKRI